MVVESRPVPESSTDSGLPSASLAILNRAERFPDAEGRNVTLIVQPAPDASVEGQLFRLVLKSPLLAPGEGECVGAGESQCAGPVIVNVEAEGAARGVDGLGGKIERRLR